jgi:glycosyltransferase involved in cell wall biosynthesis
MRIGLNATCFNDRPSGANQRFRYVYGALIRNNPDIEFVVYEPSDHRIADWFEGAPNVQARQTPVPSVGRLARLGAGLGYWQRQLRADKLDLYEAFHLPLTPLPGCPTVLTIHDLRPLLANSSVFSRTVGNRVLHHAMTHADRIIAVSDVVRNEILEFHPSASVSTVYNGVDSAMFASPGGAAVAAVRTRYGLPPRYILAVGHLEVRKNLKLLIEAVALLRDAGTPHPLAIVGNDGGGAAAIRARIAELGVTGLVTIIEHADDDSVHALYAGCDMLAFPSRYEGFGIPILEAMAANKPMVLADTAVFRELTLEQGLYFSVDDPAAAAAAINTVLTVPDERARQLRFGADRIRDFACDHLATQIASIYVSLTSGTRPNSSK